MMKTIKQIADELGVSKQAVRKEIANLSLQTSLQKNGNQFALDEKQEKLIKSVFLQRKSQTETANQNVNQSQTETSMNVLIEMLQKELNIKNEQIKELNNRLAESQELNRRQQELNAISEKKLLALEQSIEVEDKQQVNDGAQETKVSEKEKKKRWWKR